MATTGRTGMVWPTGCMVEELNRPEIAGPRLLTKPGYSKAPPRSSVELMRALPHTGEYPECAVWPDLVNQQEKTTWKRQIFILTWISGNKGPKLILEPYFFFFFSLAAVTKYSKPDSLNQHDLSSSSSVGQKFNTPLLGLKLSRVAFLAGDSGTFHELTFASF